MVPLQCASEGVRQRHRPQGPDGNLWFTEYAGNRIGRITPSNAFTTTTAKVKVTSKAVTLTTRVTVPGAGRIAQRATTKTGKKTTTRCGAKTTAAKAATYTLTCTMGRAARAQLRRSGMRVSLRTTFTPTGAAAASRTQRVVLTRHRR